MSFTPYPSISELILQLLTVNLGKSGLRVSKVILGCMTYGSKEWQKWTLGEEEAMSHIKAAWVALFFTWFLSKTHIFYERYDAGIQSFDTADVYSNGVSEEILGKAIKKFNLPRDEIVVMTKVYTSHVKLFRKALTRNDLALQHCRSHTEDGFLRRCKGPWAVWIRKPKGTEQKSEILYYPRFFFVLISRHRRTAYLCLCQEEFGTAATRLYRSIAM